jgi:MFS transporter, ACDE family, multidrug resistance protein
VDRSAAEGGAAAAHGPRTRLWALYLGGFLGPFGGQVVVPMLPEVADALGTTVPAVAWSWSAYTFAMAGLLLVSGTLTGRWGRSRTVRTAFLVYAVATLLCAAAPTIGWFYAGRVLQGASNAFTTPILVAALYAAVPRERLGRALGRFGSLQAAGMAFAPLLGGLMAVVDYRLAFVLIAVASVLLSLVPPVDAPDEGPARISQADRWRSLVNPRLARACGAAFAFNFSAAGVILLIALLGGDRFGLGPSGRGLVVAALGTAGLLTAARLGHLVDRYGVRRVGLIAFVLLASVTLVTGLAETVWGLLVAALLAGAATTGSRIVVNNLAVTSTPANPDGATSMSMSWMFLGSAVAPLLCIPAYGAGAMLGFAVTAIGAALAAVLILPRLASPAVPAETVADVA